MIVCKNTSEKGQIELPSPTSHNLAVYVHIMLHFSHHVAIYFYYVYTYAHICPPTVYYILFALNSHMYKITVDDTYTLYTDHV